MAKEGFFHKCLLLSGLALFVASPVHSADRYLVKLKEGAKGARIMRSLENSGQGFAIQDVFPEIGVYTVDIENQAQLNTLQAGIPSDIQYIERDSVVHTLEVPNDPQYSSEDQLQRTHVEAAWNTTTGSKDVVVAVSDTGFSFDHPDLKNQVWTNPNEIPGNNVDDDNNGYVDDVHGWDFLNNTNNPQDQNGHGTHVSGIIGAEGNNGIGIVGMNWHVSIMPVRFLDAQGSGSTSNGIATIMYAARNGAKIINCSWGGSDSSQALKDAIDYAYSKGTLVIVAAGNDTQNIDVQPSYPAAFNSPGLIAVASSTTNGVLSYFSNYGVFGVPIAAPGENVLSTFINGDYKQLSGTSMATPMVSGMAALMLSKNRGLSALDLRNGVLNAVDEQTGYKGLLSTSGDINAQKAVEQLSAGFQLWPSKYTLKKGSQFQFTAYQANGAVTWKVSPTNIASIDNTGTVTASANGDITVSATDSTGKTVSTAWVHISDASQVAPGASGCTGTSQNLSGPQIAGSALNIGLPVMVVGFMSRKRKRRKKN